MNWLDVGPLDEVRKRRKFAVPHGDGAIAVIVHEAEVYALDNTCIHKQRELSKGMLLGNRIVCPGHQWTFELGTGIERRMGRCQPIYDVRVVDGRVEIDVDSRHTTDGSDPAEVISQQPLAD